MCNKTPFFVLIPITIVLSLGLAIMYTAFYFALGPLSMDQEYGYGLFITAKWIMFVGTTGAVYVLDRYRPKLCFGGTVLILLTWAAALSSIASYKLREPITEEMQSFLVQHLNNPRPQNAAPPYLQEIQKLNHCCGIMGYEDYINYTPGKTKTEVSVPESCCRVSEKNCGMNLGLGSPRDRIYLNGCFPSGLSDMGQPSYGIYKAISSLPICSVVWDVGILVIFVHYFRRLRRFGYLGPAPAASSATTVLMPSPAEFGYSEIFLKVSPLPGGAAL